MFNDAMFIKVVLNYILVGCPYLQGYLSTH